MSKLICVFGSTGNQGGSVIRALSKSGDYTIRAITRNPGSDKAKSLLTIKNVTVEQGDLDDPSTLDKCLKDCYGAFLVTDFSSHFTHTEVKQGTTLIDHAIKSNLKHFVFSGLEDVQSQIGKPCLHCDYKAKIEEYGLKHGDKINFTSIRLPAYYQIIKGMSQVKPNEYVIRFPVGDKAFYLMNVDDLGECVKSIFDSPNEFKAKVVPVAGDKLTGEQIAAVLNKHLAPKTFVYGNISLETFKSFGFPGAEDLTAMFEYFQTGKMVRDVENTKKLNKNVVTFEQWVEQNKEEISKSFK
jgi:uncharacterized protein YbjT (DUF2867 family)